MQTALQIILSIFVAIQISSPTFAHERNGRPRALAKKSASKLQRYAQQQADLEPPNKLPSALLWMSKNLTDNEIDIVSGEYMDEDSKVKYHDPILHRDPERDKIIQIGVRRDGKFPLVLGEVGAGKTATIQHLARSIVSGHIPKAQRHQEIFGDLTLLSFTVSSVSAYGLTTVLDALQIMSEDTEVKIGVVLREAQFLNAGMISELREWSDRKDPLMVILEIDEATYGKMKDHPSFLSIAELAHIRVLKKDQLKDVLRQSADSYVQQELNVQVPDEIIDAIIDVAPDYRRDVAEPRRSLYLLEDYALEVHGQGKNRMERTALYRYVAKQLQQPVIPQNEQEFLEYMKGVKERVKKRVVGQDIAMDGLVDQFKNALMSRTRQHTVALALGPTGVGKSWAPEVLAEEYYGDKERYIELDMTQYSNVSDLAGLFGAKPGLIGSDKKGILSDFFDGRGRGGGIVVMNEIEEMDSEAFTKFMEIFDKGFFYGGDGLKRYVGRTLFMLTSNKNTDRIMSYEAIKGITAAERDRRLKKITQEDLKKAFIEKTSYTQDDKKVVKPAVMERIDGLYFFAPLLKEEATNVSEIEVNRFVKEHNGQYERQIKVTPELSTTFTAATYNETLGSRQTKVAVRKYMNDVIDKFKETHGFKSKQLTISGYVDKIRPTISYITATDEAGKTITIDGPRVQTANKFEDPEFRENIINLAANIKKEIFGQDEAIDLVVGAIKNHYMTNSKESVVAGFLAGLTGSGKSEIAKLIAKYLFGRKDAVGLFDMGKVQHKTDLNTIFSPGKGIIGSDGPGELEQFLIDHPDGGVLLFDEMSNAGGNDPAIKAAIAKQFYTMLNEGYYKSPSGKKYSVTNHIILFTGNDGEHEFKGLTSDSLLEERYKELMKDPTYIEKLLVKAGFPPAFMGRLAFATLMKPTMSTMKTLITEKMLGEWRRQVMSSQPVEIAWNAAFVEEIGKLMFSVESGARSINKFIKTTAGQLVADQLLAADWNHLLKSNDKIQIKLDGDFVHPKGPFYEGDKPDKTSAILKVESWLGKQRVGNATLNFTKRATFEPQVHKKQAEAVAWHEMGHAVTAFTKITGEKLVKITIRPEKVGEMSAAGYAQYRHIERQELGGRELLIHKVAGLLAGSEAEIRVTSKEKRSTGRSNDLQKVGNLIYQFVLAGHLIPELDTAHAFAKGGAGIVNYEDLPPRLKRTFVDYATAVIEESRALANKTIDDNILVVEAGVAFLLKYTTINEKQWERLEQLGAEAKVSGKAIDWESLKDIKADTKEEELSESTSDAVANCNQALGGATIADSGRKLAKASKGKTKNK